MSTKINTRDIEINKLRNQIADIYDRLTLFKRKLVYDVLRKSPVLFSLKNDTAPSSVLFKDTLTEEYTPSETLNFGTVLDQMRHDDNTVNVQTYSVYKGLLHIITGIRDNKIEQFDAILDYLNKGTLKDVNAILAIKPNAYNASVVSLEHPTAVSSSAAAALSLSSSEIPPRIRHLFTSKDFQPFKIDPYIISKDGYKERKITTSPEEITYLDRFVTFTSDILISPSTGYEREGIISGHGTPITVTIDGCKYNVPAGSRVLVRVFEDSQGPGRTGTITKQIKPTIFIDEPSSCAISGGAGGRRRRGTKRARRGRRRSSRKN